MKRFRLTLPIVAGALYLSLPPQPLLPHLTVDPNPILRIQSHQTDPAAALSGVIGAMRLSNGTIVLADCGSIQFKMFDSTGRFLKTFGSQGYGPGQFEALSSGSPFRGPGDTIYVRGSTRRISVFGPGGDFVRSLEISDRIGFHAGVFPDGSFLMHMQLSLLPTVRDSGTFRHQVLVQRLRRDGTSFETHRLFPGTLMALRNGSAFTVEASPRISIAMMGDRYAVGSRDEAVYREFDASGTLLRTVPTIGETVRVTPAFVGQWNAAVVASAPDSNSRANLQRYVDVRGGIQYWPANFPVYGPFVGGLDGRLWILDGFRGNSDSGIWTSYRDGKAEARLFLPRGFTVFEFGSDWVLGLVRDSLYVETVVLYRIVPAPRQMSDRQEITPQVLGRCLFNRI